MTIVTFSQVVMRYVFNAGFVWALELTTVFFAIMIFVGISYGVRVGAHIGVDALVKLMPPGPRRATSIVVVLLCLVYAGMVIYGSLIYVEQDADDRRRDGRPADSGLGRALDHAARLPAARRSASCRCCGRW